MAMKNKQKHIPLQKTIWCKIRYWQLLHDWTDDELAMYLNCSTRTLQNYDHDARGLTLKNGGHVPLHQRSDTGRSIGGVIHRAGYVSTSLYILKRRL